MALQVSTSHLHSALQNVERMKHKYANAISKAHSVVHTAVRTAEVGAGAFAFGMLQGRLPADKQKVMGVDVSLGSAVLLHVLGYAGIGGDAAAHLHGFGDGALASFLSTQGIKMGDEWAKKAAAKRLGARVSGELDDGINGQDLSDAELAALAEKR